MNLGINPALSSQNKFANKNVSAKRAQSTPLSNTTPLAPKKNISFGRGFLGGLFKKLTPEQEVAKAMKNLTENASSKTGGAFNPENAFYALRDNFKVLTQKQIKTLDKLKTSENPLVTRIVKDVLEEASKA